MRHTHLGEIKSAGALSPTHNAQKPGKRAYGAKNCKYYKCKKRFKQKRTWHKFHSDRCRKLYWKERRSVEQSLKNFVARLPEIEERIRLFLKELRKALVSIDKKVEEIFPKDEQ